MSDTEDAAQPDLETGESWWGGWIQTAKEKSASALEFVKKDLAEFSTTMQSDSIQAADSVKNNINQQNASAASERVRRGMSSLLDGITRVLTIPPDSDDEQTDGTGSDSQIMFDRAQMEELMRMHPGLSPQSLARLHAIQLDTGTYTNEPSGSTEKYQEWLKGFDLEAKKGDISLLLVANVEVRGLYAQLVPSSVSHADFWSRYYYKVFQLEEDEARKAELMRRADEISQQKEDGWDEDDDWGDIEGPSSPPRPGAEAIRQAGLRKDSSSSDTKVSSPPESLNFAPTDASSSGINSPYEEVGSIEEKTAEVPQTLDVKTKEKGDMVMVGSEISSDRTTPVSEHSGSGVPAAVKDESLEEDWEKDFDIEVTEEDIRLAQAAASKISAEDDSDVKTGAVNSSQCSRTKESEETEDWENWE